MNIKSFKIQIFHVFYLQKEKRKKKKKKKRVMLETQLILQLFTYKLI
jgi:hypothetical protein